MSLCFSAKSYFLSRQYAKAIPWLERASADRARTVETNYMLGNAYLLAHQPEKAVAPFAAVFGINPESAGAHIVAAEMMVRQELLDYAVREVERGLKLDPGVSEAHYLLGVIAVAHADVDAAISNFQREIALNPNFAMSYYRLGDAYSRREDWDRAIPQLQRSI